MSEQSGYPGAPPGWYPDPAGGPGQRWWDGYAWTEATVLPQHPPPPPWAGAAAPQGQPTEMAPWAVAAERLSTHTAAQRVEQERRAVGLARFAVAMPGIFLLVTLFLQRVNADQLRSAGHQFRIDWDAAQRGATAPPYHGTTSNWSALGLLVGVLTVVAVIFACMWQHKAATAGRALGIPSRYSPAWGVGSWFVPVVNLWMPYGALRACLPPGHAERPRILQWWIAWIATNALCLAAGATALVSTGAALVVSIPAAIACLVVIAWAPGIVLTITAAHEAALGAASVE